MKKRGDKQDWLKKIALSYPCSLLSFFMGILILGFPRFGFLGVVLGWMLDIDYCWDGGMNWDTFRVNLFFLGCGVALLAWIILSFLCFIRLLRLPPDKRPEGYVRSLPFYSFPGGALLYWVCAALCR